MLRSHSVGALLTCGLLVAFVACVGDDPGGTDTLPGDEAGGGGDGSSGGPGEPCVGSSCGAHGKCIDSKCVCDPGFQGGKCDACVAGLQDKDNNGTCEPACGTTSCKPHNLCDDGSGKVVCKCTDGYNLVGADCVWSGGVRDPGFQNTPVGAWTVARGALLDPLGAGSDEPGWVRMDFATVCTMEPVVTQAVAKMPDYAIAEPLALKVTAEFKCNANTQCDSPQGIGVTLNGAQSSYQYGGSRPPLVTKLMCLGERAYGGPLNVRLQPITTVCDPDHDYDVTLDHAQIVPEATCPPLKSIPNPDFESATNPWTADAHQTGSAGVVAGAGAAGTKAAQVKTLKCGDDATYSSVVSIPSASVPNTALQVSYKAGAQAFGDVMIDGIFIGQLKDTTSGVATAKVCIPEWAKGSVNTLAFGFQRQFVGQSCNPTGLVPPPDYFRELDVDNLSWVSDASCPATPILLDPGFERNDPGSAWRYHGDNFGSAAKRDTTAPHTGTAHGHMSVSTTSQNATITTSITIPPSVGAAGPAVKFFYKTAPFSGTMILRAVTRNGTVAAPTLANSATYVAATSCLDPRRSGLEQQIRFALTTGPVTAGAGSADIDDVQVTTDAACPAN